MLTKSYQLSMLRSALAIMMIITGLSGCGIFPLSVGPPLKTVDNVDLSRYMGTWFEIAKYPVSFENGCTGVTAEYSLNADGSVKVTNTCRTADGQGIASQIEGTATVADPTTNAKLTVYFFFPFGAPYWIIDLDADYQYAVVGDPTRTFLWILSRTPTLDAAVYDQIVGRLPDLGYDPGRLELMQQFPD